MAGVWAVKNHTGEVLQDFTAASRFEVGLKVVPKPYDAFRLRVSASYRELFDRIARSRASLTRSAGRLCA